jgi:glucose-6-phosphate 1-dehydrogenase
MDAPHSDALVFFGATGNLAYKEIFPSLQGLIKDEGLNIPIIGVSGTGSMDKLKKRDHDSIKKHGRLDQAAFQKLLDLMRGVQGNYNPQLPEKQS